MSRTIKTVCLLPFIVAAAIVFSFGDRSAILGQTIGETRQASPHDRRHSHAVIEAASGRAKTKMNKSASEAVARAPLSGLAERVTFQAPLLAAPAAYIRLTVEPN
jgi:hypothetical protein